MLRRIQATFLLKGFMRAEELKCHKRNHSSHDYALKTFTRGIQWLYVVPPVPRQGRAIVQRLLSLSILIHLHGNSIWALHLRGKRGYAVVPTMLSICGLCCFSEALKQVCNHSVTLLPSHCYANNNKTFAFTSFHHSIWGGNCARISIHTWNDMPFSLGILVRKWSNSSFLPQMFPL